MRLLAIDTAREACTAVVLGRNGTRHIRSETIGRGHAERLFGMIEAAMGDAGIDFPELERIAVVVGPGSFTGIRIGVAAARGFALVNSTPLAGLTTLALHAEAARGKTGGRPLLALMEGRGGQSFGQFFAADLTPAGKPRLADNDAWAGEAAAALAVLAGSGAPDIAALMPGGASIVHQLSAPDPQALLDLAVRTAPSGQALRPLYLKPPDAVPVKGLAS